MNQLPETIYTGKWKGGHIQGIAVDRERKYIYCSFTTEFVKLDMKGNLIGSVRGFTGHLGCMAYREEDGRVYASLEYKNDSIGRHILNKLGIQSEIQNAFYIAIFDVDKITRPDMDAEKDGVMTTVWLRDVVEDYLAVWEEDGVEKKHRYGCSGIDGITFAPAFEGEGMRLLVAYGIYGDVKREDNDYQVLLSYDPEELKPYEAVLTSENIHTSGPASCEERYFVYTGNTCFGIQNLEYDRSTGDIFVAVYRGLKPQYPNYDMFVIAGKQTPVLQELLGHSGEKGKVLVLKEVGPGENGIYGFRFPYGQTGMISLGDGRFYMSENYDADGNHEADICLYRYTGEGTEGFEKIRRKQMMKITVEDKMMVAGHRGDCYNYCENTMEAFKAAIAAGADMVETDVHLTKDGVLVLMHDHTVDRTSDGTGLISEYTYEELCRLNVGDSIKRHQIPTLEELMQLLDEKNVLLNLEIKEYYKEGNEAQCHACIDACIEMVEKYHFAEKMVFNSFDAHVLEYIEEKCPGRYMLHGFYPYTAMQNVVRNPDEYLYCACIWGNGDKKPLYDYLLSKGIEPWIGASITQERKLEEHFKLGAKLVTTNFPADCIDKLKRIGAR